MVHPADLKFQLKDGKTDWELATHLCQETDVNKDVNEVRNKLVPKHMAPDVVKERIRVKEKINIKNWNSSEAVP